MEDNKIKSIVRKIFATVAVIAMVASLCGCDFSEFSGLLNDTAATRHIDIESVASGLLPYDSSDESASGSASSGEPSSGSALSGELASESAPSGELASDARLATDNKSSDKLQIHFIDVGKGDAALITCGGKAMMIDGGEAKASDIIFTYLNKQKIKKLDYVIGSHADADHIGGLSGAANYLIRKCGGAAPKKVYCSVTNHDTKTFDSFKNYFGKLGKKIEVPKNRTKFSLGGATVTIYKPSTGSADSNNNSLIVHIAYGRRYVLFTGDAEVEEENAFIKQNPSIKADVLKVSHHGSKNATSSNFLKKIKPVAAVISVNANNQYGHPHKNVIDRLKHAGVVLYRTDMNGDIVLTIAKGKATFAVKKNAKNTFVAGTGTSKSASAKSSSKSASAKSSSKSASAKSSTKNNDASSAKYVLNTSSKKFHRASCSSVKKMKDSNKAYSNNRSEIISDGYSPCKNCKP